MKKMVLAIAVALLTTTSVMAQDGNRSDDKRPDKAEMVQKRTEHMAKRYDLTAEQTAKLQELNNKYAEMMAFPRRTPRGHQGMHPRKARPEMKDSLKQKPNREPRGQRGDFEKMGKAMAEYDEELKSIMTAEQYAKYEADREKMRKEHGKAKDRPKHRQKDMPKDKPQD